MNLFRRGFTLVEVLVVMSIMGILIAMELPAISASREVARRAACARNIARLMNGVASYENSQAVYPAGVTDSAGPIKNRPQGMHQAWTLRILPYMDERVAYGKFDFAKSVYDRKNAELAKMPPEILLCPDDSGSRPHSSYAACQNDVEAPIDSNNHGVFFVNSQVRRDDVSDGLAYTLFLGEKRSEPKEAELGWMSGTRATLRNTGTRPGATCAELPPPPPGPPTIPLIPSLPATNPLYVGGFGSEHPEGRVNVAFGDCSIRTISEAIDMQVYQRIGNRADGQVVDLSKVGR